MFLIIILFVALGIFVFSLDLSWTNVVSAGRNNLVFQGRNMEYGAYALRREHHMNLFYALLLSTGLIGGGFFAISALRQRPVSKMLPPSVVIDIPVLPEREEKKVIPSKPIQEPAHKSEKQPHTGTEIVVVDKADISAPAALPVVPGGADGDGGELQQPYDPDGGSGTGIPEVKKKDAEPTRKVRNMPKFPGGDAALLEYMHSRVKYSDWEIERNVSGTIYITFIVKADGSIGDVYIERSIRNGDRLAGKAMQAIGSMPVWTPGNDGDEPLPVIVTMPLKFELRN